MTDLPEPPIETEPTKTCSRCGRVLPLSQFHVQRAHKDGHDSACKECVLRRNALWRAKNPDKYETSHNRWVLAHPSYARDYRRDHPEVVREREKRYHEANKPVYLAKKKRYYRRHREHVLSYLAGWAARNPMKVKSYKTKTCVARRRAKGGTVAPVSYEAILARDGYVCYICGGPINPCDVHFDHIIPLSRGGTHTEDNIAVTHATCNLRKHNKTPEEYRAYLKEAAS